MPLNLLGEEPQLSHLLEYGRLLLIESWETLIEMWPQAQNHRPKTLALVSGDDSDSGYETLL